MTVGFSLSKSSQHSVFIEINEIKKISTWERLTMSVLLFRTIIHLHIHLDDKSCWFTLTTETYLTTVFKATHSIKSEVVRSFEKATDFFCAPYITQATNHLENYHMNTENPAWDIWVYFCKCCFKLLFPYATTSRALVQTADDDVRILFVVLISFVISAWD